MTAPSNNLQQRLRVTRYEKATEASAKVLDRIGVGPTHRRFLELKEIDDLWPGYLARLRDGGDSRERWTSEDVEHVRRRVEGLRDFLAGDPLIWFTLVNGEPVGAEVPAGPVLSAALGYLVSPAGDLMLTSSDLTNGICIEFNHLATGDEYEIVTWGISADPEAQMPDAGPQ